MNYTFENYEDAVLRALSGLAVSGGGYLKELKGYAGEFALKEDELYVYSLRGWPTVLVEVTEANYEFYTEPFYRQTVKLTLFVAAQSWRSQGEARGSISLILADLRERLLRKTLWLEILPLELVREYKIAGSPEMVLYGAEYQFANIRVTAA